MLRLIPMLPSGILCNFFVGAVVHRVPLVIIIGKCDTLCVFRVLISFSACLVSGTLITAGAAVLFALIDPSATYWEFGFPSTCLIVFGADFVYSAGSLFITKVARHGEHSIVGALFQTMIQVSNQLRKLTISDQYSACRVPKMSSTDHPLTPFVPVQHGLELKSLALHSA